MNVISNPHQYKDLVGQQLKCIGCVAPYFQGSKSQIMHGGQPVFACFLEHNTGLLILPSIQKHQANEDLKLRLGGVYFEHMLFAEHPNTGEIISLSLEANWDAETYFLKLSEPLKHAS